MLTRSSTCISKMVRKMPDKIISEESYKVLCFNHHLLESLYTYGVQTWEGYNDAFNKARENYHAPGGDQIPGIPPKEVV